MMLKRSQGHETLTFLGVDGFCSKGWLAGLMRENQGRQLLRKLLLTAARRPLTVLRHAFQTPLGKALKLYMCRRSEPGFNALGPQTLVMSFSHRAQPRFTPGSTPAITMRTTKPFIAEAPRKSTLPGTPMANREPQQKLLPWHPPNGSKQTSKQASRRVSKKIKPRSHTCMHT